MAAFLYYQPAGVTVTPAPLSGRALARRGVRGGPDAGEGTLIMDDAATDSERRRYVAAEQTWRRDPATGLWVGVWNDARPGPEDLLREPALEGKAVRLGDDRDWIVPIALRVGADARLVGHRLPTTVGRDDRGRWVRNEVIPRYQALFQVAAAVWDRFWEAIGNGVTDRMELNFGDELDACVAVLAANYRLGAEECVLLHLLHDDVVVPILRTTMDWDALIEAGKKKANAA